MRPSLRNRHRSCAGRHSGVEIPAGDSLGPDIDGLAREWDGRIELDLPYRRTIWHWIPKLCAEYRSGRETAAIAIVPAHTGEGWWEEIVDQAAAVCFVADQFKGPGEGNSSVQPLAVLYLGSDPDAYYRAFARLGDICARVSLPGKAKA